MLYALSSISARPVAAVASASPARGEGRPYGSTASGFPGLADYGRPAQDAPGSERAGAPAGKSQEPAQNGHQAADRTSGQAADSLHLSPEAQAQLRELKQRDAEVRAHEKAHMAAGGQYVSGGPSYEYQQGPDGRQYAIGGHVSIDASSIPDDPDAGAAKARQVRRAALAPGEPSAQDRAVAAKAAAQEARASRQKQEERAEEGDGAATAGAGGMEAGGAEAGKTDAPGGAEAAARTREAGPAARFRAESPDDAAPSPMSGASGAPRHAVFRAAETYAAMAQRGVMPTALAPGGTGISLQI